MAAEKNEMQNKVKSEENGKNGMQIGNRPFSTISSMVGWKVLEKPSSNYRAGIAVTTTATTSTHCM